jgi:hypothetical protein
MAKIKIEYNKQDQTISFDGRGLDVSTPEPPRDFFDPEEYHTNYLLDSDEIKIESGAKAPYLVTGQLQFRIKHAWNPEYDQGAECECGHSYERHFDSYENMSPVGCKYCCCGDFHPKE